jgi:uncharacterized protein YbjT (DUF2867 family)
MPTAVVTGIGGIQQTAIARAFRAAGWTVRGTSRSAGPDRVAADLQSGEGLATAFHGADVVAFTLPQDHRPGVGLRIAQAVAAAATEARAGRIVLNTAARIAERSPFELFAAMRAARDAVTQGKVQSVVLQPTAFMDNLIAPWSLPALLDGTFANPAKADTRIAWISHRTLAEAVVAAATADVAGQTIDIGGPEDLTGPQIAGLIGARIGRPVGYAEIPLDDFAAGLNAAFGAPAGDRIAELYRDLAAHPDRLTGGSAALRRLGVTPEPFADFIARQAWSSAA